jgi:hypothetical protein
MIVGFTSTYGGCHGHDCIYNDDHDSYHRKK